MRSIFLLAILITGLAMTQSVTTFGSNYTTPSGEQRSINLIPVGNGQMTLIDARADGTDQQQISISAPAGSQPTSVKVASHDLILTTYGNGYQVLVRPDMPPVELKPVSSNP